MSEVREGIVAHIIKGERLADVADSFGVDIHAVDEGGVADK